MRKTDLSNAAAETIIKELIIPRSWQLELSLEFIYELTVVLLATGLLLWFIFVFVPQSLDEIKRPKD